MIVGWGQGQTWGSQFPALFQQLGDMPLIGIGTRGKDGQEAISPPQIAQGKGDAYFVALNPPSPRGGSRSTSGRSAR